MDGKLYLILQDCDSGGKDIVAVANTTEECEAWFAANPDKIIEGIVCLVEAYAKPLYFGLIATSMVATKWNKDLHRQDEVSSIMDTAAMTAWLEAEGGKHPYHKIRISNMQMHLFMANSKADTELIGGNFIVIRADPRTVKIKDCALS